METLHTPGMSDFSFGSLNTKISLKDQDNVVDNILLKDYKTEKDDKHLLILVERPLKDSLTGAISAWIRKQLPGFSYSIVSSSVLSTSEIEIRKKGIYKFYKKAQSSFKKYHIPNKSIVISMGMSINAITLSSDLSVECFYDYVFNKTYFYSPEVDSYVFPIDGTMALFTNENGFWAPKDCSRTQFALYQFQQIITKYSTLKEPPAYRKPTIVTIDTKQKWKEFYFKFKDYKGKMAWDTETSGFHHIKDDVGCFTCTFDGKTGYFITWDCVDFQELNILLSNKIQVTQNGKFDAKAVRRYRVKNARVDSDTLHLAHSINEMRFNSLKSLAYYYTPFGGYDMALEDYKDRYEPKSYIDIPMPILRQYATMDAIVTFLAEEAMQKQLTWIDVTYSPTHTNGWTCRRLYETVVIPAVNKFIDMEMFGVSVDMEVWEKNALTLQGYIDDVKLKLKKIFSLKDDTIFSDILESDDEDEKKSLLQSTKKLGILLESLKWEDLGRAKNNCYLTGDEQLVRWANLGHEGAKELQTLRSLLTMQKTFMGNPGSMETGWKRYVTKHGEGDYRIHSSYMVMMMDTFRNGCGSPNYQQVPSNALHANLFKQIFTVPKGDKEKYLLVSLDMQGFQLHLSAHDTYDKNDRLYNIYLNNPEADIHSVTGYSVFSKGVDYVFVEEGSNSYTFTENQEVRVLRGGCEMKVPAKELVESDKLVIEEK